jgi:integrase
MGNAHTRNGEFRKVAEHLYRYSANKIYYAVFKVRGKRIWKSLETTDRELANRKVKEELGKRGKVDHKAGKTSLEELLKLYEESIKGLAGHTQATRKSILKNFKETWKHGLEIAVRDVTEGQLQLWLSEHQSRLKNSSLNEYIRFLRQVFNVAKKHKVIADSPAAEFKQLKVEKPIRPTPSWEQFLAIVKDIRSQRFNADAEDSADLVEFMGRAGVGTAEAAGLRGEHIDFQSKKITLYRFKTDTGYAVPIFPQLEDLLQKMRENGGIESGQPVFKVRDPKKALDGACKRLKIPHYSSRALRRCFITKAVENGVDFKTIAEWQGHKDGGVLIANTYSHLRNEHSDAMAKKMKF